MKLMNVNLLKTFHGNNHRETTEEWERKAKKYDVDDGWFSKKMITFGKIIGSMFMSWKTAHSLSIYSLV